MADEPDQEQESSASNLEPPKLFGRRKRKPKPAPAPTPEPEATTEPEPAPEPEPIPEPEPTPEPEPAPEPLLAEEAPTEPVPLVEPSETPRSSAPQEPPVVEEQPTAVYDATDPTADVAPVETLAPPAEDDDVDDDAPPAPPKRRSERKPRVPRGDREPVASPRNGSVITGVVAGALLIGLVFAGFQACEAARGSNSCGTTPGILLLLVVLAITIVVGGFLLKYFRVPDPGSTSFLAVALVGVVALLVLVDVLDTWPMLVVIPVLSAAAFLASWWITTTFVEPQS